MAAEHRLNRPIASPKAHFEWRRALRQAGQIEGARQKFTTSKKVYSAHSQP